MSERARDGVITQTKVISSMAEIVNCWPAIIIVFLVA